MTISFHTHELPTFFAHAHAEYEITYCMQGTYEFHYTLSNGRQEYKKMEPGMLIFMPKGIPHGVVNVAYPYHRYFIIAPVHQTIEWLDSPALLSPLQSFHLEEDGEKVYYPLFLDAKQSAPMVETILERMLSVQVFSDVRRGNADLHMRSLFGLLFCELYSNHHEFFSKHQVPRSSLVSDVQAYIDQHYFQPITIQELARQHFVHPNYLTHCFTRQVGLSPRKYLTQLRLANARKLLESEYDSVQSIALRVGFSNVNNFIQSFNNRYGMTPKAYRKKTFSEIIG